MKMIDDTMRELKRALDVSHVRNRVITENIANSETPGFKGSAVDFQKAMVDAKDSASLEMEKTSTMHIVSKGSETGIKIDKSDNPARADGNNVDQNIEMSKLSEKTIIYNTAAEILRRKIQKSPLFWIKELPWMGGRYRYRQILIY